MVKLLFGLLLIMMIPTNANAFFGVDKNDYSSENIDSAIEKLNQSNIEKLTNFQKQLKNRENEIKIKLKD